MDFMAIDKYGVDGGNNQESNTRPGYTDPAATSWFFNADHWNNYLTYAAGPASGSPFDTRVPLS